MNYFSFADHRNSLGWRMALEKVTPFVTTEQRRLADVPGHTEHPNIGGRLRLRTDDGKQEGTGSLLVC